MSPQAFASIEVMTWFASCGDAPSFTRLRWIYSRAVKSYDESYNVSLTDGMEYAVVKCVVKYVVRRMSNEGILPASGNSLMPRLGARALPARISSLKRLYRLISAWQQTRIVRSL